MQTAASPLASSPHTLRKILLLAASILFFAAALATMMHYLFGASYDFHNADTVDSILWAEATYDSGKLLNPDFSYAALLPLGLHLVMVPFIALFGVTLTANTWGMAIFLLLFAGALLFFFRSMGWRWTETFFSAGLMLLFTMSSYKMREIFFAHILYYSQGLLYLLVGLGLLFRLLKGIKAGGHATRRHRVLLALLGLWMVLTSANGTMTLALFTVPLVAAYVVVYLFDNKPFAQQNRQSHLLLLVLVAGTLLGLGLNKALTAGFESPYMNRTVTLLENDLWNNYRAQYLNRWIGLLLEPFDRNTLSLGGIISVVTILAAFFIFALPLVALARSKSMERPMKLILVAYATLAAILTFLFLFTYYGEADWRLIPMLYFGILTCLVFLRYCLSSGSLSGKRLAALGLALLCVVGVKSGVVTAGIQPLGEERSDNILLEYLEEEGLTYGYATFWNASQYTVRSGGAVKLRPFEWDENWEPRPYRYQSNLHWYEDQPGVEEYFLLLPNMEYEINTMLVPDDFDSILEVEDYMIFVYDHNIFGEDA